MDTCYDELNMLDILSAIFRLFFQHSISTVIYLVWYCLDIKADARYFPDVFVRYFMSYTDIFWFLYWT